MNYSKFLLLGKTERICHRKWILIKFISFSRGENYESDRFYRETRLDPSAINILRGETYRSLIPSCHENTDLPPLPPLSYFLLCRIAWSHSWEFSCKLKQGNILSSPPPPLPPSPL